MITKQQRKTATQNEGLSVHCHHDILIEYCTDFNERVEYIKNDKPKNERRIRLKVFKILSKEVIDALPKELIKALADWDKAYADWNKAYADWDKALADWDKAYADRKKARDDWNKALADWDKAIADWDGKEEWHKKFCGCKYWNGKELVFK